MYKDSYQSGRFARLTNASWPLFSAFGAEVRVHWLIVLVPLVFFTMFRRDLPAGDAAVWAVGITVALYATVWAHEMGHIAVGRRMGVPASLITLSPQGGLAHGDAPAPGPRAEVLIALAGPAVQAVIAVVLWIPYFAFDLGDAPATTEIAIYRYFLLWQVSLVVFNLLPCYPMDGGRVLRGLLARRMDEGKASFWTAQVGMAGAAVLALVGCGMLFFALQADPKDRDVLMTGMGMLLIWIGIGNFVSCRRLQIEVRHADRVYEPVESWKRGHGGESWKESLAESERLTRDEERRQRREAEARRHEDEARRKVQERIDQLLDRINEVGGIEKLSAAERRELAEASELLRREPAEG